MLPLAEIRIDSEGAYSDPSDAVVSYGWRLDRSGVVFEDVCPFVNAFPTQSEYEAWAHMRPEAVTMPLSTSDAYGLARDLASCTCCGS